MTKHLFNILIILYIGLFIYSSSFALDKTSSNMQDFKKNSLDLLNVDTVSKDFQMDKNNPRNKSSEIDLSNLELSVDDFHTINSNISSKINIDKQNKLTILPAISSNEILKYKVSLKEQFEMLLMILDELTFKEKMAFIYDLMREPIVDNSIIVKDHILSNKKKYVTGGSISFIFGTLLYLKFVGNK